MRIDEGKNIVMSISVDGKNWNDIASLPCFWELSRVTPDGSHWLVTLLPRMVDGTHSLEDYERMSHEQRHVESYNDMSLCSAELGDTIVKFSNGKWGVRHKAPWPDYEVKRTEQPKLVHPRQYSHGRQVEMTIIAAIAATIIAGTIWILSVIL